MENEAELPENTGINKYTIKLEKDKQPLFRPIYSLRLVEIETLKTYIKTNLANSFIWLLKSPVRALILYDRTPNKSLCLYIDYWGFNNITIKNQYPQPLIGKLLNKFGQAKRFTQLDLINVYYQMRIYKSDE